MGYKNNNYAEIVSGLFDDPLHPLLRAPLKQLKRTLPPSVLWEVGDTWVRCENSQYTIGADLPATEEEVRALLAAAGGKATEFTKS